MSWSAYLLNDITATPDGLLAVKVQYYDTADPANSGVSSTVPPTNVLWNQTWSLPLNTSTANLEAAVIAEGQKARTYKTAETAARTAVPKGTTLAIP